MLDDRLNAVGGEQGQHSGSPGEALKKKGIIYHWCDSNMRAFLDMDSPPLEDLF